MSNGDPGAALLGYYERCLEAEGDTAQGAGWPNEADRLTRFDVMLDLISADIGAGRICDVGCGTGELRRRMTDRRPAGAIGYIGLDASSKAITLARRKFPDCEFLVGDLRMLDDASRALLTSDYVILNGLFTVKSSLTDEEMWQFMTTTLGVAWTMTRRAMAFNVMSAVVDWRRHDLFHVEMDTLCSYLFRLAGRRVMLRADYGLYEYTAYVFA